MGKAARNEIKKITATYLNNIAVALFAAGIAIPLIGSMNKTDQEIRDWFASLSTYAGRSQTEGVVLVTMIVLMFSAFFHGIARHTLRNIED